MFTSQSVQHREHSCGNGEMKSMDVTEKLWVATVVVWCYLSTLSGRCSGVKTDLHLLGLYPMSGAWPGGYALWRASQFAVDHVNANDSLLRDYEVVIVPANSAVSIDI